MSFEFELTQDRMRLSVNSEGRLTKTFVRSYLCKNSIEMTLDEVAAAVGVVPGAPHPTFIVATAQNFETSRRMTKEPHCAWDHTIEYGTESPVPESATSFDPEDRRVKRSVGSTQQQRFIIKDRSGVLITDAAGSPLDGGVPVTDYLGTFSWDRDEDHTSTKMYQAALLTGKTNSTTFMTCAPGTLLLVVNGNEHWKGSHHYWTFNYTMTYDKNGWNPAPANAGLYQLVDGVRQRIQEVNDAGVKQNVQEPQPLYSSSTIVPGPGRVIPVALRPGSCNFLEVDHLDSFDFATLGLPTT